MRYSHMHGVFAHPSTGIKSNIPSLYDFCCYLCGGITGSAEASIKDGPHLHDGDG